LSGIDLHTQLLIFNLAMRGFIQILERFLLLKFRDNSGVPFMLSDFNRFFNALWSFMYLIIKCHLHLILVENNIFCLFLVDGPVKVWLSLVH